MNKLLATDPRLLIFSGREGSNATGMSVKTLQKRRLERKPPEFLNLDSKERYRLSDNPAAVDKEYGYTPCLKSRCWMPK